MDLELRLRVTHGNQCGDGDQFARPKVQAGTLIHVAKGKFDDVAAQIGCDIGQRCDDLLARITVNFSQARLTAHVSIVCRDGLLFVGVLIITRRTTVYPYPNMQGCFPTMKTPLDWNDLRYFTAVIRCGGLGGAARHLGVSLQTVARRIAALESAIGTQLFLRHASGYIPTEDARRLEAEAERVEIAIHAFCAHTAAEGTGMAGKVRVAAPETIATHILLPALQPFLAQHRALSLELLTGVRTIGIARGDADIALRTVLPEQGALTRKRVGTMALGLYAAAGMETDLERARLIGWTDEFDLPAARWLKRLAGREPDVRLTQLEAQRAAIASGIGIGVLPCFLAEGLIQIPTQARMTEALWLIAHAQNPTPRIRRVYDEIERILGEAAGRLDPAGLAPLTRTE